MRANPALLSGIARPFVDIVAIMEDRVQLALFAQMAIGGVEPGLIMLATGHADSHPVGQRVRHRRGTHGAHRAHLAARRKTVPVTPCGVQPAQFDMHRMAKLGPRNIGTRAHDLPKIRVLGDLITDGHRHHRHSAMFVERAGRQPRPDDEAVGPGIARCHAQREGVAAKRLCPSDPGGKARGKNKAAGRLDKRAAIKLHDEVLKDLGSAQAQTGRARGDAPCPPRRAQGL